MTVLVTGATGFIGSQLALRLKEAAIQVCAVGECRTQIERQRLAELQKAGVPITQVSLQNQAVLRTLIPKEGIVIHLAAAQHEISVPDSYFREVNVEGTRTLLKLSREARVQRFVYGSTIGVYGGNSRAQPAINGVSFAGAGSELQPLDENSTPHPQNIYERSKLEAEKVVGELASSLQTCVVRISETYGPGDMRLLKLFRAIDRRRFILLGRGQNRHQPIHVQDLIDGLLAAATHPAAAGEIFVLAGPESVTTRELIESVAAALGRRSPRLRLPLLPFLGTAAVMELGLRPLGIQPPLYRRRLDFFLKSFTFSIAKAQRLLDFNPRYNVHTGTADTARWYRAHGFLQESSS